MGTIRQAQAVQVDSDVTIERDPALVDAYRVTPAPGTAGAFEPETVTVPAEFMVTLAMAVRHRGADRVLKALQDLRDFQDFGEAEDFEG